MRGLKFISLLTFIIVCASIIYLIVDTGDYRSVLGEMQEGTVKTLSLTQKIRSYFANADSWNYLTLVAFISIIIFLFVVNDFLLGKFFQQKKKKRKAKGKKTEPSFWGGGLIWFSRMALSGLFVFIEFVLLTNIVILIYSTTRLVKDPAEIPTQKEVLLLGTNKHTKSGKDNVYYYTRIEAVVELYKAGKVKRIIISGDNSKKNYNEPHDMMRDLVKRGVPRRVIIFDYAGFRTLDSIVRLKTENHVTDVIIVSQRFHVERALFLAWFYNIEAKAFVAKGGMTMGMIKRELLAKPKVLMDLFLFNMQPKFGRTEAREGINITKDKDLVLLITVATLLIVSGVLLKNTFIY